MQVGVVNNNQTFSGDLGKTKIGNKYEKTNEGKKIYPLVAVGVSATATAATFLALKKDGALKKMIKEAFISKEANEAEKDEAIAIQKLIKKPALKAGIAVGILGLAALGGLIQGVFVDLFANHTIKNDADRFAETGEKPEKTNKGKLICGSIGLGIGGFSLLSTKIFKN